MTPREKGAATTDARIAGRPVPVLMPEAGEIFVLLVGEAPGPRGADKSGVPFFGDAAGRHLYQVLTRIHAVTLPEAVNRMPWDGAGFLAAGLRPVAHGVALGNAFDRCPTDNGIAFRAPLRSELEGEENVARLTHDLHALIARGLRGIVTLGRVATKTIDVVLARAPQLSLIRHAVPHPSAQGLLSMAPDRGRGARMSDLQESWMVHCQQMIIAAGYPADRAGALP